MNRDTNGEQADGWSPENLRKNGLTPATVFDVGAGPGTPALYRAFPDSYFVLIEPLDEFEPMLRQRLEKWSGEIVATAIGDAEGETVLHVNAARPVMSSLLQPAADRPEPAAPTEPRTVPVTTLDKLIESRALTRPFGLKIDIEGAEHLVIKGAERTLRDTQFVIAEVWASRAFGGGYTFTEFMSLMESHNFELRDVLHVRRSRMTKELMYIDALFRPASDAP
jgi:FkbM family methyltransferase